MLQDRLGLSERRACRYVGQHRSTQRHESLVAGDDGALRARLRRISRERPRWGYRRAHQLLLDDGWQLNIKRTRRVWREEGLRVPRTRRKRQLLGDSTVPADRLRAQRPDHVGAIDFQWDQTADGHNLKLLHVVDEFTREALAIECARRIDPDKTVDVLDRLVGERGTAPGFLRCDNGPEMTANALRDWLRGWEDSRLWGAARGEKQTALLAPFPRCRCCGWRQRATETGGEGGRCHHAQG